jgi:glutamate-1-semialdehyde aminotransferase
MQVGSIAQYWQKVLPEAIVEGADGELTMSYGVIGLLASIATARKVEDHERRIAELEKENKELREQLKAA